MSESIVQKKLARLIQEEMAAILMQGKYVSGGMLTVSQVRVTGDLSLAKIYVSIFPDSLLESAVESLNGNHWELRKLLSARIRNKMRKMPELRFYADDSFREADRIEQLFKDLKDEDPA